MRYNLVWRKDGRTGTEMFKWRGYEGPDYSAPTVIKPFATYPMSSSTLAQRVDLMDTIESDEHVRIGGLHELANVQDQDTFYGMAINFITFGTTLPWDLYTRANEDEDYDEDGDEMEEDKAAASAPGVKKIPGWWKDGRDWWDPSFRRAQVGVMVFPM